MDDPVEKIGGQTISYEQASASLFRLVCPDASDAQITEAAGLVARETREYIGATPPDDVRERVVTGLRLIFRQEQ